MRQIVLDTETTGLDADQGHRIIEIGAVELIDRKLTGNHFHQYLRPDREIDVGAIEVHGITNEFLSDKPYFSAICNDLIRFIQGAELIMHNAPFDVSFIDAELAHENKGSVREICTVLDSLSIAREMYPGQRNNLDALCKRLGIDNSQRILHGALLDAEILADVYLLMTGGQVDLSLEVEQPAPSYHLSSTQSQAAHKPTSVILASDDEQVAHEQWLDRLDKSGQCLWRTL